MADLNRQMVNLSKKINILEKQLGESSAELAELRVALAPFLARYKQVLSQHERLVEAQRELSDIRSVQGDEGAQQPSDAVTALTRLLYEQDINALSVSEQYERTWKGKEHVQIYGSVVAELPEASDRLKKMYMEIVPRLHPGLTRLRDEYKRRKILLEKVDTAYARRDLISLQGVHEALIDREQNLPTVVDEDAVARLRRRVFDLEQTIANIEGRVSEFRFGEIARVKAQADFLEKQGRDLLSELFEEMQQELDAVTRELNSLKSLE
jgi:uncharacterized coiled-coil DUF342 family protein